MTTTEQTPPKSHYYCHLDTCGQCSVCRLELDAESEPQAAPLRFRITYGDYGYKVSIPNYDGGEVVAATDYDAIRATASTLAEALRAAAENNHSFHAINGNGDRIRLIECEAEACTAAREALALWEGKAAASSESQIRADERLKIERKIQDNAKDVGDSLFVVRGER